MVTCESVPWLYRGAELKMKYVFCCISALPFGWEECYTEDGLKYYVRFVLNFFFSHFKFNAQVTEPELAL